VSESASSESLNTGKTPDDHHMGINEDKVSDKTRLRRAVPLKLGISKDETDSGEQLPFTVEQAF
jgi:hypothetical protein